MQQSLCRSTENANLSDGQVCYRSILQATENSLIVRLPHARQHRARKGIYMLQGTIRGVPDAKQGVQSGARKRET